MQKVSSTKTDRAEYHNDFGITDAKGRKIGAVIVHFMQTNVAAASDAQVYRIANIGTFYGWNVQATRDGIPYGAGQVDRFSASDLRRVIEVRAYLDRMAERYTKAMAA